MLLSKHLDKFKKFGLTKYKYGDINFISKLGRVLQVQYINVK